MFLPLSHSDTGRFAQLIADLPWSLANFILKSWRFYKSDSLSVWTLRCQDWLRWTGVCSIRTFGSLISRLMKTNQKPSLELLTSFLGLNHVLTLSYHNSQKQKWDKFKTLTRTIALTITVVILIYFGTLDFILRIIIQNEEQDHTIKLKQWSSLDKIGD